MAKTSEVRKRLLVELDAGGGSPRDMEYSLEKALGQVVLSQSADRELPATLTPEDEAFGSRELSGDEGASLFMAAVSEPVRRGGSKPGVVWVGALWVEGRKELLTRATANRER